MANFEVLMVSVEWESPEKIRNIIPAKRALKPSKTSDNKYDYDIVLYHTEDHSYFQLAIKTQFKPYFKDNQGIWNELYQAIDDIWIIKGEWKTRSNGSGYHYCHSINTAGKIQLAFRDEIKNVIYISVDVNINIDDFDFEQLKDDFEGQLWSLITSNKSIVKTDKVEFKYGNRLIRFPENKLIIDFIKTYEVISKNPKSELSLLKAYIKNDKVIPIAETYRKISTTGITKTLPSKSASENFDIYENRLICSFLYRIYYILIHNSKTTSRQIDKLKREIKNHNEKIVSLEDTNPKVIIEEIIKEIEFQKEKVTQFSRKWEPINEILTTNPGITYRTEEIALKTKNKDNTFWCSASFSKWCIIEFPDNILGYLDSNETYRMDIEYLKTGEYEAKSQKKFPIFKIAQVKHIESLELFNERNILTKQKQNLLTFENNQFYQKSIMNNQEILKFEAAMNIPD